MLITDNINICDVIKIAKMAGEVILEVYNSDFSIEYKKDDSPLTLADKKANDIIVKSLKALYPDIPILSEESKHIPYEARRQWKYLWLVDPLDGTKEFIKRNGEFTVNIALIEKDTPILGVIYAPVKQLLYFAFKEDGAFMVDNAADVINCGHSNELKAKSCKLPLNNNTEKFTIVASRSHMSKETENYIEGLKQEYGEVNIVSAGSSLKFCLVAEGKADVYPRFAPTMEWDTAAGHIVVEEAGGKVREVKTNSPLKYNKEDLLNPLFIVKG